MIGVCREFANVAATLYANNGHYARIIATNDVYSSPHVFAGSQDNNKIVLTDSGYPFVVPGAKNLQEAAMSYDKVLSCIFIDPLTHRVTDVITTPDLEYLDQITDAPSSF
ncbi:MAG: hypothetical protein QF362_03910 [Candidatus Woesearchaeota archaeon]|jgi:hypothetical protein|nr:hypothetical protein [Candidatus Woesearchaeota archaeon]MDP7506560.1 hypothetical protein [Candidatus Woesearchaeota archaeon]|tara:strand:- start:708 stop:1037 length:330 start_codon:yes stop_codon:yes gene_type:complete